MGTLASKKHFIFIWELLYLAHVANPHAVEKNAALEQHILGEWELLVLGKVSVN